MLLTGLGLFRLLLRDKIYEGSLPVLQTGAVQSLLLSCSLLLLVADDDDDDDEKKQVVWP